MSVGRLAPDAIQPKDFALTAENTDWAKGQIAKYPPGRQASAVIPLLWKAQEQAGGWTPRAAIEEVAAMLDLPYIRVLEIATFYTMFNLAPVGRHHVQLCGTVPCHVCGAVELAKVCEQRIGPQNTVTADGKLSWIEVECLGACCNAPMAQINFDYYEDLNPENFAKLLDDLVAGRPVKTGSQTGRQGSEPEGGGLTLRESSLFDGSQVGAWKEQFEERAAKAEAAKAEAAKAEAAKAEAAKAEAAKSETPKPADEGANATATAGDAKQAAPGKPGTGRPENTLPSTPGARAARGEAATTKEERAPASKPHGESASAEADKLHGDKPAAVVPVAAGSGPAVPGESGEVHVRQPASPKDMAVAPAGSAEGNAVPANQPGAQHAPGETPTAHAVDEATARREEADIATRLATLPKDATPAQKADAVGTKPQGLGAARAGKADNLTRIKGIGKVNEARLHDLGIFHFDQIAAWTRAEIRWVGTYLAFPGRIDREDWIGQAKALAAGGETEFSRRVEGGKVPTSHG